MQHVTATEIHLLMRRYWWRLHLYTIGRSTRLHLTYRYRKD